MDYKTTVFISYSWENEIHNKKVERFVKRLRENHINVFFDRDMPLGERFTDFMEMISRSEYVLFICTPVYKEKADLGKGGVKYEKNIITAELYERGNETKFIPVLFSGTWNESLPIWAKGKKGIDYTTESNSEFNELLRHLQSKNANRDISEPTNQKKILKICISTLMTGLACVFILILLPFDFKGLLQQKYDNNINQIRENEQHEQETEKSNEDKAIEPLKEFPFRIEYNVLYPETKEIKIPTPEESGTYSMEIPLDLRAEEYQSEKVPVNSDIHGFVVNNLYYCSDDDSITDISGYNFYKFADYWLYLHTIDISFTDYDGFNPDLNGATIVLQEKETQKKIVLQENYLSGQFVQFQCSTGQYIIEVQKGGIAYTCNLNLNKNEKTFLALSADDYYYLSSDEKDSYIVYEDSDKDQNSEKSISRNEDSHINDTAKDNPEEIDNDSEDETIKDTEIYTSTTSLAAPDLIGMDEATAVSTCTQNGYKYSVEYYLGGNGFVISQLPTSSESIETGESITINIGISQSDFSSKLLELINEKRRASGLGDLSFSEQLNTACNILAEENVNSVDCTRPDGSGWSSVLWENNILLNDGTFTTRNNITSLSDANGRIKYSSNSYGNGNLLTPSYTLIGMAYSSNNMLVIIVGN